MPGAEEHCPKGAPWELQPAQPQPGAPNFNDLSLNVLPLCLMFCRCLTIYIRSSALEGSVGVCSATTSLCQPQGEDLSPCSQTPPAASCPPAKPTAKGCGWKAVTSPADVPGTCPHRGPTTLTEGQGHPTCLSPPPGLAPEPFPCSLPPANTVEGTSPSDVWASGGQWLLVSLSPAPTRP